MAKGMSKKSSHVLYVSVNPYWHTYLIWIITIKYQMHHLAQVDVGPYST